MDLIFLFSTDSKQLHIIPLLSSEGQCKLCVGDSCELFQLDKANNIEMMYKYFNTNTFEWIAQNSYIVSVHNP